jgi:hypothetical protein
MCSYIVETIRVVGSAKSGSEWGRVERANVYYDHPYHAPLDHALCIDLVGSTEAGRRVAVELDGASARALAAAILAALDFGESEHEPHEGLVADAVA